MTIRGATFSGEVMRILKHESGRELKLNFWLFGWFGELFAPSSDFEGLWLTAKVRPSWWWFARSVKLFFLIIFRNFHGVIIMPGLAWEISRDINREG